MKEESAPSTNQNAWAQWRAGSERWRRTLRRAWWVPALLALAAGIAAASWTARQPPTFTSWGRMIVNVKLSLPEGSFYVEELSNFMGTQSALMQSPTVLNRAHARAQSGRGEPLRLVQHPLKVGILPKTTIFTLSATGCEPETTRLFLQACMEEYLSLKEEMRATTSDTTVAGLAEEVLKLEKELRQAEAALAEFQSSNSLLLLQDQVNGAGTFLAGMRQRLALLRWEQALAETPGNATLPGPGQAPLGFQEISPATPPTTSNQEFIKCQQQVRLLKAEEAEWASVLRPRHPKRIALRDEIDRRERMLAIFEEQSAEEAALRKQTLDLQVARLSREVEEYERRAGAASRAATEFTRLKTALQRTQGLYDRLLGTLQTLDVNKEISPESVTLMEPAGDALPDPPQWLRNTAAGLGLGTLLGLGLLGFVSRLDDRLFSLEQLTQEVPEPLLAQVPLDRSASQNRAALLVSSGDPRHALVEAFRSLRSSLLFLPARESCRTLLITSATPNEGKSIVSANLAVILAHAGLRVLLVDADNRKGSLDEVFGVGPSPGLAEVLRAEVSWKQAVISTATPNFSLLPRGRPCDDNADLIPRALQSRLLQPVSAEFDWVILDSPPVLAADDATTIAPLAGGVVFVLRSGKTSARIARAALGYLRQRQATVLGLVFNGVRPAHAGGLRYNSYGGYGKPPA